MRARSNHASLAIGQAFSTASDITDPDPPETDQPYAGLLAATTALHACTERSLHNWYLLAGVVGPPSYAEETQKFIHAQTGSDEPLGWHTPVSYTHLTLPTIRRGWGGGGGGGR